MQQQSEARIPAKHRGDFVFLKVLIGETESIILRLL